MTCTDNDERAARSLDAIAKSWFDRAAREDNSGERESCNRQGREAAAAAQERRSR